MRAPGRPAPEGECPEQQEAADHGGGRREQVQGRDQQEGDADRHRAEPGDHSGHVIGREFLVGPRAFRLGSVILPAQHVGEGDADPCDHEDPLIRERDQKKLEYVGKHNEVHDDADDDRPNIFRHVDAEHQPEERLHVDGRQVEVRRVDSRLADPDEDQAQHAHHDDKRPHHRNFGDRAAQRNGLHEKDPDKTVDEIGQGVERKAEVEEGVIVFIFALSEPGEVECAHHHPPDAHECDEHIDPAVRIGSARRGRGQPGVAVAVLRNRVDDGSSQAEKIERKQVSIELVEPVLNAAEDKRDAVDADDERRDREIQPVEIECRGLGDDRSFEHRIINAADRINERCDCRSIAAEKKA